MVSLIMKRVEGEYGTLHVRHFGVGIERRPFRENTNLEEEVIFAAAATLQRNYVHNRGIY